MDIEEANNWISMNRAPQAGPMNIDIGNIPNHLNILELFTHWNKWDKQQAAIDNLTEHYNSSTTPERLRVKQMQNLPTTTIQRTLGMDIKQCLKWSTWSDPWLPPMCTTRHIDMKMQHPEQTSWLNKQQDQWNKQQMHKMRDHSLTSIYKKINDYNETNAPTKLHRPEKHIHWQKPTMYCYVTVVMRREHSRTFKLPIVFT